MSVFTFPYLRIAKRFGIDYGAVIRAADDAAERWITAE